MLSAKEARARVQARLDRNLDAEREQLLEKIGHVIATADCLVVHYPVRLEHATFVQSTLELEGYTVITIPGSASYEWNFIISFEE